MRIQKAKQSAYDSYLDQNPKWLSCLQEFQRETEFEIVSSCFIILTRAKIKGVHHWNERYAQLLCQLLWLPRLKVGITTVWSVRLIIRAALLSDPQESLFVIQFIYTFIIYKYNLRDTKEYLVFSIYGDLKFCWYSSLDLHLWSLGVYNTIIQHLLAFWVFFEKSSIILIGLPLYVFWYFFLCVVLNIISLFCMFSILVYYVQNGFFFVLFYLL